MIYRSVIRWSSIALLDYQRVYIYIYTGLSYNYGNKNNNSGAATLQNGTMNQMSTPKTSIATCRHCRVLFHNCCHSGVEIVFSFWTRNNHTGDKVFQQMFLGWYKILYICISSSTYIHYIYMQFCKYIYIYTYIYNDLQKQNMHIYIYKYKYICIHTHVCIYKYAQ